MAVITGRVISRNGEISESREIGANSGSLKIAAVPPAADLPHKEEGSGREIRFFTDPVRVRRDKLGAGAAVMVQLIISAAAALALWLSLSFGGEELREALFAVLRNFI